MINKILVSILVLSSITIFSIEVKQDKFKVNREIYLIGTIHSMHFDSDNHYSIIDLQAQISALKPDLVCGEITPEAFDQAMEGYFPPEAAFLAQMASKLNYRFVPVDWRMDYATQSKAENEYPLSIKEQVTSLTNTFLTLFKESNNPSLYDYIHSELNLKLVDSLHEKIVGINPVAELAFGSWHERNRRIVENGLTASKDAQRIVFVFGADHIPEIQRQLKILGIEAEIPKRLFVPSNDSKVSEEVLERWERNLENLKLIRDRKIPTIEDNYQKVIHSRRIQDIELAIQKSS